jgi:uncharacterized membrane protein
VSDSFTNADLIAGLWFLVAWVGYGLAIEHTPLARYSLNSRMDAYRFVWMRQMIARDLRIVDTTIMGGLQNGTAFFASTSLIALGGALSFLRASEETLQVFAGLPFATTTDRMVWETKLIGLAVIFAYAFFKFAWSYRLMNYAAILIGATPTAPDPDDPKALAMAGRAAAMNTVAGAHFNRGQRAFFFALGYLGWFVSPYVCIGTTAGVLIVMATRQFGATSRRALAE